MNIPKSLTSHPVNNKNSETAAMAKQGKVLIVEDDLISCKYLALVLKRAGIENLAVENGLKAIEKVQNNSDIGVILMDIRMPGMDGIEAAKQIKKMKPHLPIIVQTAYGFSQEKEDILAMCCDDYLSKPIRIEKLMKTIKKYITMDNE
ncbi:MAG: response regulator [Candidatus Kapaibacterium sp.]